MKKINLVEIKQKMLLAIKERELHYKIICEVEEITSQFEGQKITKRIMTAVKKAYPSYTYHWDADRSYSRSFSMWGDGIEFNERITIYLPFGMMDEEHIYSHSAFIETNQCHFLDKERNERAIKQAPLLESSVEEYNNLVEQILSIQEKFTEYPLTYIFEKGGA